MLPTTALLNQKRFVIRENSKDTNSISRDESYWIKMVPLTRNVEKNTFMLNETKIHYEVKCKYLRIQRTGYRWEAILSCGFSPLCGNVFILFLLCLLWGRVLDFGSTKPLRNRDQSPYNDMKTLPCLDTYLPLQMHHLSF